jgi:hypothetical protein
MKINKKLILISILLISLGVFSACNNSKDKYKSIVEEQNAKIESLNSWAKDVLNGGSFDERIEVLTEYTNINDFQNPIAADLSASLRKDIQTELDKKNLEVAYEMSKKLFKGMALTENIGLMASTAKEFAKSAFDAKEYQKSMEAAGKVLEAHWDEEAMGLKLGAELELMKQTIADNNIAQAKNYYDDIMNVTSLKGNENLAKTYRAEAEKYSDKFAQ